MCVRDRISSTHTERERNREGGRQRGRQREAHCPCPSARRSPLASALAGREIWASWLNHCEILLTNTHTGTQWASAEPPGQPPAYPLCLHWATLKANGNGNANMASYSKGIRYRRRYANWNRSCSCSWRSNRMRVRVRATEINACCCSMLHHARLHSSGLRLRLRSALSTVRACQRRKLKGDRDKRTPWHALTLHTCQRSNCIAAAAPAPAPAPAPAAVLPATLKHPAGTWQLSCVCASECAAPADFWFWFGFWNFGFRVQMAKVPSRSRVQGGWGSSSTSIRQDTGHTHRQRLSGVIYAHSQRCVANKRFRQRTRWGLTWQAHTPAHVTRVNSVKLAWMKKLPQTVR